ncbi:SDR family NAD(P)-dependent oxidoreductase [Gimesia aquarii]|uniref:Putative oxidoreductase n=1 Tax=Gimesia aquarii TaxID=2527964 RepID=A0A517WU02_9PLAN|nr:SDR family NAD(P)-dependent oxidoreductase [Gimesia aquarii]QDU08712.1 putative oxidoreductase [Gimesia aquarii]
MSSRNNSLHVYGPWAVITGASSGIGRAMAVCLAEAGLNLVLVARQESILSKMCRDLENEFKIEVRFIATDLSDPESFQRLIAQTQDLEVGLFVAAAGFGTSGKFIESHLDEELNMADVNCLAVLKQVHHFAIRFQERTKSGIILFSSIVGFQGTPNAAHYSATKAYIQNLGEALSVELSPHGIDVLTTAPGPTSSGFADRAKMKMGMAMTAESVAINTLRKLGRRHTVLPGFLSKLLVYIMTGLPRWAKVKIMGHVMHGMASTIANTKTKSEPIADDVT